MLSNDVQGRCDAPPHSRPAGRCLVDIGRRGTDQCRECRQREPKRVSLFPELAWFVVQEFDEAACWRYRYNAASGKDTMQWSGTVSHLALFSPFLRRPGLGLFPRPQKLLLAMTHLEQSFFG